MSFTPTCIFGREEEAKPLGNRKSVETALVAAQNLERYFLFKVMKRLDILQEAIFAY